MADERVDFIIENVASLCHIDRGDRSNLSSAASSSKAVKEFLDDPRYASQQFVQ